MADTTTTTGTEEQSGGFPPFDQTTFPTQIFWLVVTFAFLFVMMWKVAGPRIHGAISSRRGAINSDIEAARATREEAEKASAGYEAALAGARSRAGALVQQNRQRLDAEITHARTEADAAAKRAMDQAEERITATRAAARGHIAKAAEEAAIAIVARLTGETVPAADAAAAVKDS